MDKIRVVMCLALLLAVCGLVYTYYAYATEQNWDELFHVKSSLVSPSDLSDEHKFSYSIDHPSIKRHVYGWVLHALGVYRMDIPDVDYNKGKEWNIAEGRIPPMNVVVPLRLVNAAFVTGAFVLLFFTALRILKDPYLALLTASPLLLSNRVAQGVVGYLGCDAILAFFLALSLFIWVLLAVRGRATGILGVVVIGCVAGLTLSSKLNGGLIIIAYCIYLVFANRGIDRLIRPILAALVCGLVFVALNPVMRGGLGWMTEIARGMLHHRQLIWETQYSERPMPRLWLVTVFFPYGAFVTAFVVAAVILRREKWVLPLCIWALVLVVGTLASVNRTYARYNMPIDMATFTCAGLLGWGLIERFRTARAAKRSLETHSIIDAAGAFSAALTGALLLTLLVAYEPLGPLRIRSEKSVGAKVLMFYRQLPGYYEMTAQRDAKSVRDEISIPTGDAARRAAREREPLGLGPTRLLLGLAFAISLTVLFVFSRRVSSSWVASGVILVLLWLQFSKGAWYAQTIDDKLFVLFALFVLVEWACLCERPAEYGSGRAAWLGICSGLACAANGFGIALAAGTTYLLVSRRRGMLRLLLTLAVCAAMFAAAEPHFSWFGARGPLTMVRGVLLGALQFWPAMASDTPMFLKPVEYYFPWLPLLPLGAAMLYACAREKYVFPAALWSALTVVATLATRPSTPYYAPADVNFALVVGVALPSLAIAARILVVKVSIADDRL